MKRDLLLEIGTEEIPARMMSDILDQLQTLGEKLLSENRISFESVRAIGTPRRLALIATAVDENQTEMTVEKRGPSAKIAFDADQKPTKAAIGFARGAKIDPSELVVKDGYIYAVTHEHGQPTAEILKELFPKIISSLNFKNSMHWGDLDFKFVRPIRWIVALFGEDVVPFEIAGIKSGKISRGHRVLSQGNFEISNPAEYEKACEENFVIVDQHKRRKIIRDQIIAIAEENHGTAEITEDLLDEVNFIVEYPTALIGSFDEKYLKLPQCVVVTPMRDHQRYFPVVDKDKKLLPKFITVRNGGKDSIDVVTHGNERVLKARLEDAQFFFDEDRKLTLSEHRDKLKTVVFQEGLGSMYDKTDRLEQLVVEVCNELEIRDDRKGNARRAARLCKADLVTSMVMEFTELQGTIGYEYARLDGEMDEVAIAIDEHYRPRFSGDDQPKTFAGKVVSIADKIDNIVATFSRGLVPTGSQDPFALRRQAMGLVKTLIESKWSMSTHSIVDKAIELLPIADESVDAEDLTALLDPEAVAKKYRTIQGQFEDFIGLRLKNVLSDEGIRYDIIDSVIDADNPYVTFLKAKAVEKFVQNENSVPFIQSFVRVMNIAKNADISAIHENLFKTDEEKNLFSAYKKADQAVDQSAVNHDFEGSLEALKNLSAPIDKFFDKVMVMDKDESIKKNRLALMKEIDELLKSICDFSKLVI